MSYASKDSLASCAHCVQFYSIQILIANRDAHKGSNTIAIQRSQTFKYILTFHLNHFLQEKVSDVCNSVTQTHQIGVMQI
jgi:hypothetical protein